MGKKLPCSNGAAILFGEPSMARESQSCLREVLIKMSDAKGQPFAENQSAPDTKITLSSVSASAPDTKIALSPASPSVPATEIPLSPQNPLPPDTEFDDAFAAAARDYRMLLDKEYPVDASLKLVGDRYRLSHNGRMMLYRGILSRSASQINLAKLVRVSWEGAELGIDGYNVLFTLTNYLHGHPMFIATDGFLRDVGGAHGRIADHRGFERMAEVVAEMLSQLNLGKVTFFLDAPVSSSGKQAAFLREAFARCSVNAEVRLENGVDHFLACWEGELIATADSAIIARTSAHVFDLARYILERQFNAHFPPLASLIA
jgi:hypothetical protein